MSTLHRHQLARLSPAGWQNMVARPWDPTARACLTHWAAQGLPLMVTRQPVSAGEPDADLALGLPAPGRWDRRRIALKVARRDVLSFDEFAQAAALARLLPDAAQRPWRRLCAALLDLDLTARVYGSYGWQLLSGLDHVREGSDIDLWVAVSSAQQADAAAASLQAFCCANLRLDGELIFNGDTAVAWREWLAWRTGGTRRLLVKTIAGASLADRVDQICVSAGMEKIA